MKNLFKILFIFLSFIFLQGITPNFTPCEASVPCNYIQNNYQTIVLTSQNINQEIILQSSSDNASDFLSSEHVGTVNNTKSNLLNKYSPLYKRGNIHNLSTYLTTEISIRAP